jgi:hypothetical protein
MRHVNFRQLVFCSDFCGTTPERRIAHEDDRFHFVVWHCPWEEVIAVVEAEKERLLQKKVYQVVDGAVMG